MRDQDEAFFSNLFSLISEMHTIAVKDPTYRESFRGQGRIISLLAKHPNLAQREIAYLAHVKPGSLTEVLDRLEREELIIRQRDEHDRRILRVSLTATGQQAAQEIEEQRHRLEKNILSGITHEERQQFLGVVKKMRNQLKKGYGEFLPERKELGKHDQDC